MADKNQLKTASKIDFADDDPFAELTRIMGFDPRQPVRKPEPVQAANAPGQPRAPVSAPVEQPHDDDFTLDLEKELLGGFDFEDDSAPAHHAVADVDDMFSEVPQRAQEADHDFDFSGDFDVAMANAGAFELETPAPQQADLDDHFGAAFPAPAARAEPQVDHDDFDLGLTDDDFHGLGAVEPARQAAAQQDQAVEADLDAALQARLSAAPAADAHDADFDFDFFDDHDFQLHDHQLEPAAPVLDAQPVAEAFAPVESHRLPVTPEQVHAAAPEMETAAEFDFELDERAFDFEPSAQDYVQAQVAFSQPEPVDFEAEDRDFAQPTADFIQPEPEAERDEPFVASQEPIAASNEDISFDDLEFGHDFAAEDDVVTDKPAFAEIPAYAPAPLAAAPEAEPKQAFEFSVPAFVPRKLPTSPIDVAAEEVRQRQATAPVEAADEFNLEDELNALLGNARPSQPAQLPTSPAAAAAATAAPVMASSYEPAASQPALVQFDAPEHPVDIGDDMNWDFDNALAESLAPEPEEPELADEADDYAPQYNAAPEYNAASDFGAELEFGDFDDGSARTSEFDEINGPLDLDQVLDELDGHHTPASVEPNYDAFVGMAAFAPAAAAGLAARASDTPRLAAAGVAARGVSQHRDPVVRADPLKEDPLNRITQLTEEYARTAPAASIGRTAAAPADHYPEDEIADQFDMDMADAFDLHPEIETIEVSDKAVALAEDFDIPELPEEEEVPRSSAHDDLDAEFSSLLSEMNAEPQAPQPTRVYEDLRDRAFHERPFEMATPVAAAARPVQAPAYHDEPDFDQLSFDAGDMGSAAPAAGGYAAPDDYEFEQDFNQDGSQHFAEQGSRKGRSRGLLIAGLIAGVAVIGGIGAFAFSFGSGGSDTPELVQADDGPVKVRPENPGGASVPNQESQAYDRVAGGGQGGAQQEQLVTTAEEPLDVTPPPLEDADPSLLSGKSEDRIEQIVQDAEGQTDSELAAVAPRKVRTMVVRADGTLVEREADPAEQPTNAVAAAPPPAQNNPAPALAPAPGEAPIPDAPAATAPGEPADTPVTTGSTPDTAPIAPLRPANQPVDVVGEVAPTQVAAATTAAAAAGGWAMQIASQPSEAAAQSSYQDLQRRYSGVLQGRQANIVRAEIEGKGTFWRVRVPANTRNEAITLCEQYKAAGGNCFVSR